MIRNLALAALSVAILTPASQAQTPVARPAGGTTTTTTATPTQGGTSAGGTMAVSDPLFAQAAAIGGLTEVQLAQLGVQKATDPELKRFSQHMLDEHTKMNSEMMALFAQKRIPVPAVVDQRAAFQAQSLAGLSGQKFDACYAKAQFLVHLDSVETFQSEAERGQDPDVKALAARSLGHIKEHYKQIKPIAQKYEQMVESGQIK